MLIHALCTQMDVTRSAAASKSSARRDGQAELATSKSIGVRKSAPRTNTPSHPAAVRSTPSEVDLGLQLAPITAPASTRRTPATTSKSRQYRALTRTTGRRLRWSTPIAVLTYFASVTRRDFQKHLELSVFFLSLPSFQWWWGCYLMFPFVSVPHRNHCLLYIQLLCFHIFFTLSIHFLVVFLGFFSRWYSSVMLLLAAVRFPFLIHARTNLVFALLFCQTVSFLDVEYHAQSHFSFYHILLLSTIFLTMSFLLWGFVFHLLSSSTNILNRAAVLELWRFHTASFFCYCMALSSFREIDCIAISSAAGRGTAMF